MSADDRRVLLIDRDPPSGFMQADRRCLESSFVVERLVYPGTITPRFVVDTFRRVARNDVVYVFFGSEHGLVPALAARLLRKRFVLVPGGYDYANVPERGYGLAARGRGWLPRLLGRICDVAVPVSRQARREFLALVPTASVRTELGYLAVDPSRWEDPGVVRDPNRVVTLAYVDEEGWSRKGIDRFVAAARQDPGREYVLAGPIVDTVADDLARNRPANLVLTGRMEPGSPALARLLWSAGVYAQFSWHETFGVAVAEAMLCGCVPVLGASPALHEVAGPWAVSVRADESDEAAIARAAAQVVQGGIDHAAMRSDVADRFSLARREAVLRGAVVGATA
jgi:glycosyltransferase involved in cell wall biosynthesis